MVRKQDVKKGSSDSDSSDSEDEKKKKKKKKKEKEEDGSDYEDETETEEEDDEIYCSVRPEELPPEPKGNYLDRDQAYKRQKEWEEEREKERIKKAKKEEKRIKKELKKSGKKGETPDFRYAGDFRSESRVPPKRSFRSDSPPRGLTNAELRALEAENDKKSHLETGRTTTSSRYKSEGSFRFRIDDELPVKQRKIFKNKR